MKNYPEFRGQNWERISEVLEAKLEPMSVATIVANRRLGNLDADMYCDSGDAYVNNPSRHEVKIVRGCPQLWSIIKPQIKATGNVMSINTGMEIDQDTYDSLPSTYVFSNREVEHAACPEYTYHEAISNPIWKALGITEKEIEFIFNDLMDKYECRVGMGIELASSFDKKTTLNLWNLGGISADSFASADDFIDCEAGRLVGVKTKDQVKTVDYHGSGVLAVHTVEDATHIRTGAANIKVFMNTINEYDF